MKSPKVMEPKIRVSEAYRSERRPLVAVPEDEYREFLASRKALPSKPIVFQKRPLSELKAELVAAYPGDPKLVADIIAGLKRSSIYAKRSTAAR